MFQKVLIAEDHESSRISIQKTLEDLHIRDTAYVYYCDDALMQLRKAEKDGVPFELLITDLSFEEDHRPQQLKGGAALIAAAKQELPDLKIIVLSSESRPAAIDMLFDELKIDGYVRKARSDAKELAQAVEHVAKNRSYLSPDLRQTVRKQNSHDFSDLDVAIVNLLSGGYLQKEMPDQLKKMNISPSSLSSVEKRLNLIKDELGFSKNEQLVAYCKDMGII